MSFRLCSGPNSIESTFLYLLFRLLPLCHVFVVSFWKKYFVPMKLFHNGVNFKTAINTLHISSILADDIYNCSVVYKLMQWHLSPVMSQEKLLTITGGLNVLFMEMLALARQTALRREMYLTTLLPKPMTFVEYWTWLVSADFLLWHRLLLITGQIYFKENTINTVKETLLHRNQLLCCCIFLEPRKLN